MKPQDPRVLFPYINLFPKFIFVRDVFFNFSGKLDS